MSAISRRYAKALVNLGVEQQMVEQYGSELAAVNSLFDEQDLLRLVLESPTLPLEKKKAIYADLIDSLQVSPGIKGFVGLLLEKGRIKHLGSIFREYSDLADEVSGVIRANIYAASEMGADQQQAICGALEKQTGKKVKLKVQTKPDLIGGLQAEIGGQVFDGSVKTQLKRIQDTLKKG